MQDSFEPQRWYVTGVTELTDRGKYREVAGA
jgi:hypothetical protein